jgi:hypothetical protein
MNDCGPNHPAAGKAGIASWLATEYLLPGLPEPSRSAAFTIMKIETTLAILAAITLLVGCATPHRGPACGHEQEFRQQLADSVPVKGWGYKIQDLRFSEDYHKALVTFAVPGKAVGREAVLKEDDFRRYSGEVRDYDKKSASEPLGLRASITVTYPRQHTSPAYKYEQQFRRQLTNSVPVKDWGYKIQEIRFSDNCHKALVLCLEPGAAKSREFTLVDDGFRRFSCPVTPYDAENREQWSSTVTVTVTLPDK